jgi:glycosyltransferase involved in cell wall biosynthesis
MTALTSAPAFPSEPRAAIHAVILTLNEEVHLARCIDSIKAHCASITIVDSGSTDRTVEIAQAAGANVVSNRWVNYATQMNFAIDHLAGQDGWLFRIDADEVLEPGEDLAALLHAQPQSVTGILVRRRIYFLGRRIRYGTIEPSWQLRLWRNGRGRCEQRWMDEHIRTHTPTKLTPIEISDKNLNSITWWTVKHNSYASREAIDLLNARYRFLPESDGDMAGLGTQARIKRWLKERLYRALPGGLRSFIYFLYRYIVRLGFLDGKAGFYFHVLQGFWYRTLVDAKVSEIIDFAAARGVSVPRAILDRTGFAVGSEEH